MQVQDVFGTFPVMETERLRLRPVTREDAEDMFRYCADPDVSEFTTWYPHQTMADTWGFIEHLTNKYTNGELAPWGVEDKATSTFIGTCGFVHWSTAHASAELGYALSKEYWNKGLMTEAAKQIVDFGFRHMGLVRIEARCLVPNIGSAKVMEKLGMTYEGTMRKVVKHKGTHQDLLLYAIVREDS
ncbi:GNAT family N-acetyltransferase [Paenibacillus sp. strain BS8-2]